MQDAVILQSFKPLFTAITLAFLAAAPAAQAQYSYTNLLEAKGYYQLGSDPGESMVQDWSTWSVDVLSFPSSGPNNAGLHSYGSQYGDFGSRSSGYGVYDVTGSFRIVQTIVNSTSTAQQVHFNFYITPGLLQNDVRSVLEGEQFVASGLVFDIRRDGASVWGSSADLKTTAAGTTFSSSGAPLYTSGGNPTYYTIVGSNHQVDMGVLGAGESMELSYTLSTYAMGNAAGGPDIVVPERSFIVPDQWVQCTNDCGYGYGGYGGYGYGGYGGMPIWEPGEEIIIPGYTIPGQPSGSHASSGDPFSFDFSDEVPGAVSFDGRARLPAGMSQAFSLQFAEAVPEPSTYGLMGLGLLGVALAARRRPAGSKPSN